MHNNQAVGKIGEEMAQNFLQKKGYKILEKNFRTRFGEIDLIVSKVDHLRFVEVKTRVGTSKGMPYEAVNYYKIKHLQRACQYFLLKKNLKNYKLSLDVISIILKTNLEIEKIDFFENINS